MSETTTWPKVSVMIITYNQEHLISDTLESVLNQDYENLEIVVADDCSTDRNQEIILEYQNRYPGLVVPVFNKSNLGITGNSNAAFFACTGDLIAVLGGDDLFLPGKLKAQAQQFIDDPDVVLSYHPVDIFLSQTNETLYISNQGPGEDVRDAYDLIEKGGIAGASSVMVRRSACPLGGFDMRLPMVSDWMFYIEVALAGKVVKLDVVFGRYRKHGMGASERTYELLEDSLNTLTYIQEKFPENKRLKAACLRGGARYLAGEVYRQLPKNPTLSKQLADRMVSQCKSVNFIGLWAVANIFNRFPFLEKYFRGTLIRLKYKLKRHLS
jgi:glycosyltransferase involved in cell wall biosynthesis